MSQFTPQELEEFEFRERAEKEFAAKQTPDARDTEAAVSNVVYPAVGAAVGAAAGSLPTKIVNGMVQDPMTGKWMAVENYARQMAQGKYYGGQNYNQVWDKIREYNLDPTQGPRLEKEAMANRSTGQKMLANTPKPLQGLVSKPMGVIGRGTVGLGAGLQGSDALNRYKAGDTSGSIISGIGALGTAAAMIPHPVTRIGGTAIGLGAEGLNTFLDYLKKKSQKPAQPQAQPQQMAEGGSAKKKMSKAERAAKAIRENNKKKVPQLADGGQVGMATPIDALPVKFGTEAPNSNPYGFTAPTGPSTQALVPYYNKTTGESWTAPSGGYTPPSADWLQGSPGNSQVAPLPGFAPGMDPVKPNKMPATLAEWQAQQGPVMTADVKPWAGTVDASGTWKANTPEEAAAAYAKFAAESNAATPIGITPPSGGGSGLSGLIAPTLPVPMPQQQPYMPMMGNNLTPPPIYNNPNFVPTQIGGNLPSGGSGLNSLVNQPTNAPKPVAQITPQQPFQQRRVAPPLSGNINPSFAKRALPYTPKPIPKPMPRRRMFAEGGSTTPAWQRSEGKSPSGGLNALGRASYKRETGGTLKAPQPEGGSRKKSFCARMGGMKKKLTSSKTANDPDSRINKALRKWKC